jgi:hypothetical protein
VDDYSEGDNIEVEFDLRGREWNGKYFTNLQAWRINRAGDGESGGGESFGGGRQQSQPAKAPAPVASTSSSNDFDDDIPF